MLCDMEKIEITVIGAGVVGLTTGLELSKAHKDIFIIEKNSTFGQETSSRNSEVIHAGIYYPKDSLKAETCVEGRGLLYEFCAKNNIAHKKIGKLIVATQESELADLEALFKRGLENGVRDLKILSQAEIKALEPNIKAEAAIYSPSTGIIDSHSLMKELAVQFKAQGGQISYNTELIGMDRLKDGYELSVKDNSGEILKFFSRIVINSAGLNSDRVAAMIGLRSPDYRLKYCKGDYFRVGNNKAKLINRLIYPVPRKKGAGLGMHATLDLGSGLRLGPDDEYVDEIDYKVDESKKKVFYEGAGKFLPFIKLEDITPDTSGIRPKLQGPNEDFRDFIIKDEIESGLPGLINLIGIESPGLTGCFSIARIVKKMAEASFLGVDNRRQ